jgi:hypothetical protein
MATEQELKNTNPLYKEFQNLLDKDFKDRKLKENEIIKATVTEIKKNFIVVDCKAKMEGMIPIEEFKNDDELEKLKIGDQIDVYLERIESFKGEIVISRDKARKMKAWKKMEKIFETQEEITGYITGKVKGGFIATVDGLPCFMPSSQIDVRPLKRFDHLMNTPVKVIATRIDKNRGNVCVSRRAVLEKSKNAEITEALKNIKENDIIDNAVVKATTDWGIFLVLVHLPYFNLITFSTYFAMVASITCLFNLPVSTTTAFLCFFKGLCFLFISEIFLNFKAFLTSINFILLLIFFNSLYLLFAAIFKLQTKKNFTSEFGII